MAEVDIMYGKGISQTGELIDMAADKDIIKKAGSWYSYGDDRIGQGRENAKQYLEEHTNHDNSSYKGKDRFISEKVKKNNRQIQLNLGF